MSVLIFITLISSVLFIWGALDNSTEKSIAVLPFKNLSADPENQYFTDGMMQEIVQKLSKINDVRVVPVSSANKYRNSQKSLPKIAKDLNVSYTLNGSVLKENNKIKVVIQFNDAKKDKIIWSESFNREFEDIFELQSTIAKRIAQKLEKVLSPTEIKQINKRYTKNTEAYQMYLKGRYFWLRRTKEDLWESLRYFNEALNIDPDYSLAYAGLADAYLIMAWWGWYPWDEGMPLAKRFASRAIRIDKHLSEAHAVLGGLADWYDKDWKVAERELKRAITYNPDYAVAHHYYGEFLQNKGKFIDAINQLNIAIELNPNSPAMYSVRSGCYYNIGKYKEALDDRTKWSELRKSEPSTYDFKLYVKLAEDVKALNELVMIVSPDSSNVALEDELNHIHSESGIKGVIQWNINRLNSNQFRDTASGFSKKELEIAYMYSLVSEWDSAMVHLERYSTSKPLKPHKIKYNADFKPLQNDPRFIDLIKKLGLEDL